MKTQGIHHISAMVGDPQENLDFYGTILGLRFVKKTVNFDDPGTYHFYFGNESGAPGTIITFFPFKGMARGQVGAGQVGTTAYAIPVGASDFWKARLTQKNVSFEETVRFGEQQIAFEDPHGLQIELVERKAGRDSRYEIDGITRDVAIKGFAGATLLSRDPSDTAKLLTDTLGLTLSKRTETVDRYIAEGEFGNVIDVVHGQMPVGRPGTGTVHHIAWRATDQEEQLDWMKAINAFGLLTTEVKDRNYFTSIYFHDRGRILHEIATDNPGFAIDEDFEMLGEDLKLPEQFEAHRTAITNHVTPITVPKGRLI
ncbi:VOC family protein [Exiguobacterium sp. Leaf196]|jgi:glyoxalase family protein|uniref:VOC family protein n=1 Tax=Exiguobacterium sp. Leaf196 TaxID=1736298 RepID=UPI0006F23B12|nr:VOC family protein [Exiguobacterium sp. Leaf196]KQS39674.1 ring-cleaving dioxygenase [Exiguobacterium sp. Leaf196]